MSTTKTIKSGKVEETPDFQKITLRGVEYTITELDVDQYDACLKDAEDKDGNIPLNRLLRQMVTMAVRPMPSKPWKYPVYRTLETIVNEMHFTTLDDEKVDEKVADEAEAEAVAPND